MLKLLEFLFEDSASSKPLSFEDEAIVQEVIQPGRLWRVRYDGSFWNARSHQEIPLKPGDVVYVVGRYNITLLIKPRTIR